MALRPTDITEDAAHDIDFDGFSLAENGTDTIVIEFRDGVVDGQLLWTLPLAAGEGASIIFPQTMEVTHAAGVFVKTTGAGVIAGVLYSKVG